MTLEASQFYINWKKVKGFKCKSSHSNIITLLLRAVQFYICQLFSLKKLQEKYFRQAQYMQLHLVTSFTPKHSSRFTHLLTVGEL